MADPQQLIIDDSREWLDLYHERVDALRARNVRVQDILINIPPFQTADISGPMGLKVRFDNPGGIAAKYPGSAGQFIMLDRIPSSKYPSIEALEVALNTAIVVELAKLLLEV